MTTLELLNKHRKQIMAYAADDGIKNIRFFARLQGVLTIQQVMWIY